MISESVSSKLSTQTDLRELKPPLIREVHALKLASNQTIARSASF